MNKIIANIPKNSSENLRIELTEYKGCKPLAICVWTKGIPGLEEAIPMKSGFGVQIDLLPQILEALNKVKSIIKLETLLETQEQKGNN